MNARYRVRHLTHYRYEHPVASARHLAHLSPRDTAWQQVEVHALTITPPPTEAAAETMDYHGNRIRRWAIDTPHDELFVEATSTVALTAQTPRWLASGCWREALTATQATQAPELVEFTLATPLVPLLDAAAEYARPSFTTARPLHAALLDFATRMRADFDFDPSATTIATPLVDVLAGRRGVCQDFAHFALSALRRLGFAARYVSGYVVDARSTARGGGASHAWIAAWCPTAGWIGCDPTNGKLADLEFVTLGWGRDFNDVTPLRGVVLGHGNQELNVSVEFDCL